MEGEMIKRGDNWFVKYQDFTGWGLTVEYDREIPLHPDNIKQIKDYERVFDNIEARILSNPKVKFDLSEIISDEGKKTLSAKIINL